MIYTGTSGRLADGRAYSKSPYPCRTGPWVKILSLSFFSFLVKKIQTYTTSPFVSERSNVFQLRSCAAFFAYGLTGSSATVDLNVTQMGITCCFLSGIDLNQSPLFLEMSISGRIIDLVAAGLAMVALSVFDLPRRVFSVVPKSVKDAMPVNMGKS